ncbi:hypothetical protein TRAPUB_9865 [Trametes pubescens]|uniref:DUF6533 domain-containing protein n=1 Tax=Trametes pubescens TaxID=154538 RepID=A0A1M2W157_TRAPU|nr:hypothetical protein TRAPUB_9865 [Trametes pubescens]
MASSLTITEAEKIIANYAFFFLDDCANWAESAVVFYEYVISFDDEVRLVWRRKITGASVIFFLNRYLLVLQSVITVASYWPVSNPQRVGPIRRRAHRAHDRCRVLGWLDLLFNVFPYFVWNVFSMLRVYALSGRDWRLASLVCLLMAGSVVANVYNLPTQRPDNMPPPYNCEVDNALTVAQHTIVELTCAAVVLLSRCTLIAGDATVLGVTWWKTWSIKKAADAARISTSLVDLLLRDGTLGTVIHPDVHTDPKRYS